MRALLLLCLAACGRIWFDPLVTSTEGADARGDALPAAACQSYGAWGVPLELSDYTTAQDDWEPAVSPDGQYLVFGRNLDNVYIAQRAGNGFGVPRDITELDMTGFDMSIAWAFDGDEIYYSRNPTMDTVTFELWRASFANGVFSGPQQVPGFSGASPPGSRTEPRWPRALLRTP